MYVINNAVKSITRNKLRNILIGIIVLVIAVSACIALSIRQAAETTKEDTLSSLSITATISYDRTSAMKEMASSASGENMNPENMEEGGKGSFDRGSFDFDALTSSLTLDEYLTYTEALEDGDSYYYTASLSLNASGDLLPYGTEESSDDETEETTADEEDEDANAAEMGGKGGFSMMTSSSDFTVTGYSSYDAMLDMFDTDGTYSITDGEMFDEDSSALECVISDELALYNGLEVGDTITLCNPDYEDETYEFTIVGIYTNTASSDSGFSMNDPANSIFTSYGAITAVEEASAEAGNVTEDSDGEETSAALASVLSFTYTFANADNYESFAEKVYDLGLSGDYTVSSSDLSSFEESLTPLETLSTTAMWFFLIVVAVGGIILITINIFNLRERKYEVGVLTAIGMKKSKVSLQFLTEIFIVTFIAIIIGAVIGACVSVPVTNALLDSQIESSAETQNTLNENFGFSADGIPDADGGEMSGSGKIDRFSTGSATEYVTSVSSATNIYVILELILVGLFLTLISSLAALISIMRYEPLKILSSRS
ncbi:MAG: ABC transporter permease [Clostridiales bacterium]|nr:ABC transporter permease [Clostridiales bacterium]